jgi:hypothetical protein
MEHHAAPATSPRRSGSGRSGAGSALVAAIAAVALAVGAVACSSGDGSDGAAATSTTGAPATTGPGGPGSTAAGPGTTGADDPAPGVSTPGTTGPAATRPTGEPCRADVVAVALGEPNPGAGQVYAALVVRNTSTAPCTLTGHPRVALLDAGGAALGDPASPDPGADVVVDLPPGGRANALLHTVTEVAAEGRCRAPSAAVEVQLPGDTTPIVTPATIQACGDVFGVGPFTSGAGTP